MATQLEQIAEKTKALDALLSRAILLAHDGDRAPYIVTGQYQFGQGTYKAGDIVFTIPSDADMFAVSLNLFLGFRVEDTSAPLTASDRTFRPTDWAFTGTNPIAYAQEIGLRNADAVIQIRDTNGPLHPGAISMAFTFSQRYGTPSGPTGSTYRIPQTAWFGKLTFDCPYYVKRGTAVTVNVSPLNFGAAVSGAQQDIYRVFGILEGEKKVKAFK